MILILTSAEQYMNDVPHASSMVFEEASRPKAVIVSAEKLRQKYLSPFVFCSDISVDEHESVCEGLDSRSLVSILRHRLILWPLR